MAVILFLLLQSRWGTTPGKKLFQIRIVDRHGLTPSPTRLAARAVIQMLPLWGVTCVMTCGVLGLAVLGQIIAGAANLASAVDAAVAVFARDRRSLHDRFFDTRVVLDARIGRRTVGKEGTGLMWQPRGRHQMANWLTVRSLRFCPLRPARTGLPTVYHNHESQNAIPFRRRLIN